MKALMQKYLPLMRELFLYGIVGVTTTLVNLALYWVFTRSMGMPYLAATFLAFALSTVYAFFTNKIFVFESKSWRPAVLRREAVSFFSARAVSCVLDFAVMAVGVHFFPTWDFLIKVLDNILVIILNYLFSKFLVFRKESSGA